MDMWLTKLISVESMRNRWQIPFVNAECLAYSLKFSLNKDIQSSAMKRAHLSQRFFCQIFNILEVMSETIFQLCKIVPMFSFI